MNRVEELIEKHERLKNGETARALTLLKAVEEAASVPNLKVGCRCSTCQRLTTARAAYRAWLEKTR